MNVSKTKQETMTIKKSMSVGSEKSKSMSKSGNESVSKNSTTKKGLEEKMYQPNMLKKMDIDKISDNASVTNTDINHGTNIAQMVESLNYGP